MEEIRAMMNAKCIDPDRVTQPVFRDDKYLPHG